LELAERLKEIENNKKELRNKIREKKKMEENNVKLNKLLAKRQRRNDGEKVSDDEFTIDNGIVKKKRVVISNQHNARNLTVSSNSNVGSVNAAENMQVSASTTFFNSNIARVSSSENNDFINKLSSSSSSSNTSVLSSQMKQTRVSLFTVNQQQINKRNDSFVIDVPTATVATLQTTPTEIRDAVTNSSMDKQVTSKIGASVYEYIAYLHWHDHLLNFKYLDDTRPKYKENVSKRRIPIPNRDCQCGTNCGHVGTVFNLCITCRNNEIATQCKNFKCFSCINNN
jgi:hypothetical protein